MIASPPPLTSSPGPSRSLSLPFFTDPKWSRTATCALLLLCPDPTPPPGTGLVSGYPPCSAKSGTVTDLLGLAACLAGAILTSGSSGCPIPPPLPPCPPHCALELPTTAFPGPMGCGPDLLLWGCLDLRSEACLWGGCGTSPLSPPSLPIPIPMPIPIVW